MSEDIADTLDGGDECTAASLADQLKDSVDAAIAAGRVPPELERELQETVVELQNGINCTEESDQGDEEKDKGEGKKNGHADETTTHADETTTVGVTVSTTEEG